VLDPFTGSGTTGLVAIEQGFRFLGFEISPAYCAMAEARIAAAQRPLMEIMP
jgi:site-specific DNA-methyltransferase (adenine-specific)